MLYDHEFKTRYSGNLRNIFFQVQGFCQKIIGEPGKKSNQCFGCDGWISRSVVQKGQKSFSVVEKRAIGRRLVKQKKK